MTSGRDYRMSANITDCINLLPLSASEICLATARHSSGCAAANSTERGSCRDWLGRQAVSAPAGRTVDHRQCLIADERRYLRALARSLQRLCV